MYQRLAGQGTNLNMDSNNTLNNRTLWYDGSLSMTPAQIISYLQSGKTITDKVYVTDLLDEDVKKYNDFAEKKLKLKNSLDSINTEWDIPEKFKKLNVEQYIFEKLLEECQVRNFDDDAVHARIARTKTEIELFKQRNMFDLLKTLIYIVDELKNNKVVWGTGRGSSCSSYILYLIQLHDVDSVKYELNINEFLR